MHKGNCPRLPPLLASIVYLSGANMKRVFAFRSQYGFTPHNVLRRLATLTNTKRQELAIDAAEAMREQHVDSAAKTPFSYIANGAFSGEAHPCQLMACRLNRIDS